MDYSHSVPEKTTDWTSHEVSSKAWMSIRDADLLESLLIGLSKQKKNAPLRVIEWGCGRSTLWYGRFLEHSGIPHQWLGLEHNQSYFESAIAEEFISDPGTRIIHCNNLTGAPAHPWNGGTERVVALFDHGAVAPFESQLISDREVNMDAYVSLPAKWNFHCDLAIIDGRKRRRCTLEAQKLIGDTGIVFLHDAWREHYQSAWPAFKYSRRIGDEWWIGINHDADLTKLFPWHAFDNHASRG
ncbi:TPA: hypothetical protein SLN68_000033 [Serratia marcescens]|uniref:hypothetical protein n=1 Tax=Serratia marcescens TaxID=615 RepID=UPI0006662158|nr:hypothetical protein [Serratia marcescens]AVE48904.1 hypothetical protein AM354_04430 [Serratia marcescens]MBH2592238.1 hypothetical protein [Serratia marcescens]MBH2972230.1 hypothetical protein [Serratia marcescens]MBH2978102.1 hypothetical protein [Serratia marcescens]MBN3986875.1 hypothetical protein [Serratia marcescens]